MLVVCRMAAGPAAEFVIAVMRGHHEDHCRYKKIDLVVVEKLFGNQEEEAQAKKIKRGLIAMVPPEAMAQGVDTHGKCQGDHSPLKYYVVDAG